MAMNLPQKGALSRGFSSWWRELRAGLAETRYRRRMWRWLGFLGAVTGAGSLAVLGLFAFYMRSLPPLENLERIEPSLITKVYGHDSTLVHEFYTQRRIWRNAAQFPQMLKDAVFSIEDHSFTQHWGVDLSAYPSAIFPVLIGGRARGASTLTQQLAKNLFLTPERSLARKVKEVLVAIRIEQTYTKDEILEFYFNQVYLGAGAYGFAAAAERYFSLPLDSLRPAQYATLAGLLQRPEAYRPDRHPEAGRERRNIVLAAMKKQGVIDGDTYRAEVASPMGVSEYEPPAALGGYFMETVRQFMEKKWNEDFVYNQGVKVWSTLDSGLQRVAESSLVANLHKTRLRIRYRTARTFDMPRRLKMPIDSVVRHWDSTYALFDSLFFRADTNAEKQRFPDSLRYVHAQAALILVDNATGAVRALIGGDNFERTKYNRALQATRSPGSSFKPFVYAAAVDNGASPADMLSDQPITIPDPVDSTKVWRPHNFEPGFEGKVSMRRALYRSMNLPAIEVGMKYGLGTVASYARRFGLEHSVPAVPSLSIGSCEATLLEMVSAYTAFPNGGVRTVPYLVSSIDDKAGNEVYRHFPETHEVLRKETAWILTTMMRDVNIRGTAARVWASGFDWPSGGKTGTTNDYTDAWYVGYTNLYTCGVWVGADDHKGMGRGHTGSDDALPIWLDVMFAAMKGKKKTEFPRPEGVVQATVCTVSGLVAQPFCEATNTDWFLASSVPTEPCSPDHHHRPIAEGDISTANRKSAIRSEGDGEKADPRVRKTF